MDWLKEAQKAVQSPGQFKVDLARRLQRAIEENLSSQAKRVATGLAGALEGLLAGATGEEREALEVLVGALRAVDFNSGAPVESLIKAALSRGGLPSGLDGLVRGLRSALARASGGDVSGAVRQALEQALSIATSALNAEGANGAHFLAAWLGGVLLKGGRPRARRLAVRLGWAGRLQLKLEVSVRA